MFMHQSFSLESQELFPVSGPSSKTLDPEDPVDDALQAAMTYDVGDLTKLE